MIYLELRLEGSGSSRAREFHPHPLTEPCVKVSPHTALHTQRFVHRHNLSQMVLLLSSYPPLCLRVVQFQLLECVAPFAPCPLQTIQRYYGAIRHRSGLRYVSALFVTTPRDLLSSHWQLRLHFYMEG